MKNKRYLFVKKQISVFIQHTQCLGILLGYTDFVLCYCLCFLLYQGGVLKNASSWDRVN